MSDAQRVVSMIQSELSALDERIRNHAYLQALDEGRVPRERLQLFAGEQYHIISTDLRSVALMLSRFGGGEGRNFFQNFLQGELAAFDALWPFGAALGMNEAELSTYDPLPGAYAYSAYVARLALYATEAEIAGAFLVNLAAWGANCGRMSQALRRQYAFQARDVAFFDLFAAPLPAFEQGALSVMDRGLAGGTAEPLIRRAARLLQAYELMFWDTLWPASQSA